MSAEGFIAILNSTPRNTTIKQLCGVLLLIVGVAAVAFIPSQSDFAIIILSAALAFISYCYITFIDRLSLKHIFLTGILVRLLLLFAFPNLSDDIYRFVWDGQLIAKGLNPYGYLPSAMKDVYQGSYLQMLYKEMNSPEYYTIYPPITQLVFYISTWVGEHIWWSGFIIKLSFLIAEVFTFFGLVKILDYYKEKRSEKTELTLVAIYFLNPLILLEGMVNLHFEILMVCFLTWAVYFSFVKEHIFKAALFLTLSIATKLLPLMFLPFYLFGLSGKKRITFFLYGLILMIVAFLPIGLGLDIANFGSSVDLYFQKFEFNASLYYILRYIGQLWSGYNLIHYIGPFLGLTALILIVKKSITSTYSLESFIQFSFYSFCAYLLLATTVHPWYLTVPILLSVFVKWRFAVVWSLMILLSYINYSYQPYWENLWIVSIEYSIVFGFLFYELKMLGREQKKSSVGEQGAL